MDALIFTFDTTLTEMSSCIEKTAMITGKTTNEIATILLSDLNSILEIKGYHDCSSANIVGTYGDIKYSTCFLGKRKLFIKQVK